jgi:hypothetical protein
MLYSETIDVYFKTHIKHTNILCTKMLRFLLLNLTVHTVTTEIQIMPTLKFTKAYANGNDIKSAVCSRLVNCLGFSNYSVFNFPPTVL